MKSARVAFAAATLCSIAVAAGQATQPGQPTTRPGQPSEPGQPRQPSTQPGQTRPGQMQPRDRMSMPRMEQPENLSAERKALAPLAGFWTVRAEIFGGQAGGQPQTEEARAMRRWVLDGTFLQELHTGPGDVGMGGDRQRAQSRLPGIGYFGYDQEARAYNAAWLDASSGAIHSTRGQYDQASKTFTYTATDTDPSGPAQGGQVTVKLTIVSDDEHTVEMFNGDAQGEPVYRMTYTRAAGGPGMGEPGMGEPGMDRPGMDRPGRRPAAAPGQDNRPTTPPGQNRPGNTPGTTPPR